ncbi:MAG TPA: pyruvate dehydrogenase complex dihydrolipoamide acetyltransferase [Polyangiaceae bacterium]
MAKILEMPKLSPTMEEGVLSAWHKKEGDAVAVDDLLADVETDKATMEFRAFDQGTMLKLLVTAGSQVKLGQPVAILGATGEDVSALIAQAGTGSASAAPAPPTASAQAPAVAPAPAAAPPAPSAAPQSAAPQAQQTTLVEARRGPTPSGPVETLAPPAQRRPPVANPLERTAFAPEPRTETSKADGGRVLASPYIRKIAREKGIDLEGARGTGPGGRLVPEDLEALRGASSSLARVPAVTSDVARPATTNVDDAEVRPLSPMRKTIARRLTASKTTVPHFYLTIDVDASELVKLRETINADLASSEAKADGGTQPMKISLNDLLIKACSVALVRVPECNASFTPEAILVHKRVDISVAVAIPDGLVTPIIRNADRKSVVAVAGEVRELASRARARKLKPEEMQGGTFSISNLGMFGIDEFSAVINPPEGAILAVGQVRDVPVVSDGEVVPGKRLTMTMSCDHRVVDGAVGASFLAELRRLVEHPLRVLTG